MHDVRGANDVGVASVWTANGVHAAELGSEEGSAELPTQELLAALINRFGVQPTHILPRFQL